MSITLEQAKALERGQILHESGKYNKDGTCRRWKVSGKPKVWKSYPNMVKVPIRHGLCLNDYITETALHLVHLEADCDNCVKR